MQTIYKLSAADAASVENDSGGGQNGHFAIFLLNDDSCLTLKGATFMTPRNPGPVPTIEGGIEAVQIVMQ